MASVDLMVGNACTFNEEDSQVYNVSEWVSGWVSGLVSRWVSEWVGWWVGGWVSE